MRNSNPGDESLRSTTEQIAEYARPTRTTKSLGTPRKHGQASIIGRTKLYQCWCALRHRCKSPTARAYKNYGGRGITVDPSWNSFEQFANDVGDPPSPDHSLDRIDNNGPYSKENCRWVEYTEQVRNSRVCKLTKEKSDEIRRLYQTGDYYQYQLAKLFGVSQSNIHRVVTNKLWT